MPVKLNLLPPELAVSKSLSGFLKTLRALGVIGIAGFLVFGIGLAAFFIVSTISLNGANANITKLTNQISAQQKSEQQIILVKDRVAKIASIQGLPSSLPNLAAIDPYLTSLQETGSINEMAIGPSSINLSINLKTYTDLSAFLESLQSSDTFGSVTLTSFSFNPTSGYSVEIEAVKK